MDHLTRRTIARGASPLAYNRQADAVTDAAGRNAKHAAAVARWIKRNVR